VSALEVLWLEQRCGVQRRAPALQVLRVVELDVDADVFG
jgi:hypothetical protein